MKMRKVGWTYPCELKKIVSGEYGVNTRKDLVSGPDCLCGGHCKPVKVEVVIKFIVKKVLRKGKRYD